MNDEPADIMRALYGDGILAHARAFPPAFADALGEDMLALFADAQQVPGGALARGPQRWYVEVSARACPRLRRHRHPPVVRRRLSMPCSAPTTGSSRSASTFPFQAPRTSRGTATSPCRAQRATARRLNSLAFNLTAVDTMPAMGPFEIAPGTQWDDFAGCAKGMFPPRELWPRYIARAQAKLPKRGDISARSALTIHRGTANRSDVPRPVFVVGVDAPDATNAAHHDLQVTPAYLASLPPLVRDHLTCRVVDDLTPVIQHHRIDGLLEPAY